jgi:hypothetical protein
VLWDADSDEIALIHVLEDIFPEVFPHRIEKAVAVSTWNVRGPDEIAADYQATLVVKIPGKRDASFTMNLEKSRHRHRAIQGVLEIPIEREGNIEFEVLLNGTHAATHTVRVHPAGERPLPGSAIDSVATE